MLEQHTLKFEQRQCHVIGALAILSGLGLWLELLILHPVITAEGAGNYDFRLDFACAHLVGLLTGFGWSIIAMLLPLKLMYRVVYGTPIFFFVAYVLFRLFA